MTLPPTLLSPALFGRSRSVQARLLPPTRQLRSRVQRIVHEQAVSPPIPDRISLRLPIPAHRWQRSATAPTGHTPSLARVGNHDPRRPRGAPWLIVCAPLFLLGRHSP